MTHLENRTGFPAELFSFPTIEGQEVQVLVVQATFVGLASGELLPAPEQRPLQITDSYFGDPAFSSLRFEAEIATEKTRVDVVVNGTGHAPGGRPVQQVIVGLEAGKIRKFFRVVGDRFRGALGPSIPRPFVSIPLTYERAYGGTETHDENPKKHQVWKRNPIGLGFRGMPSHSSEILTEFPNLQALDSQSENSTIGFGIVSRAWSPRLEWAGTFDQKWLDTQWPLLPNDFDVWHYQAAPLDQQADTLSSEDPIRLTNLTPDGEWTFALPKTELPVWLISDNCIREVRARMDTVVIEPELRRVSLTFRLKIGTLRGKERLREIVIGAITRGGLLARQKRKPYIHMRDLGCPDEHPNGKA